MPSVLLDLVTKTKQAIAGSSFDNERLWNSSFGPSIGTASGEVVTPSSALGLSAYYSAIRVIAEDLASRPLITYYRTNGGKERAVDLPEYNVLRMMANADMSAMSFWETMFAWAVGWGNAYAEIESDPRTGEVYALWPIHPSRVRPMRDKSESLYYEVRAGSGSTSKDVVNIRPFKMLHVHGLGPDGVSGYSLFRLAATTLGLGIAQEKFGSSFFGNGTHFGRVFEFPQNLDEPTRKRVRESLISDHGGASQSFKNVILWAGGKIGKDPGWVPPREAQMIEQRQFTIEEIARWFRVSPVKIGHNTNIPYANIEQLNNAHDGDTLLPWAVRAEQELFRKLFAERYTDGREVFCEFLFDAILRADSTARSQFYNQMFGIGAMSINEIRAKENMNPIENGDKHYVPLNMLDTESSDIAVAQNDDTDPEEPEEESAGSILPEIVSAFIPAIRAIASRLVVREKKAIESNRQKNGDDQGWIESYAEEAAQFARLMYSDTCAAFVKSASLAVGTVPGELSIELDDYFAGYKARIVEYCQTGRRDSEVAVLHDIRGIVRGIVCVVTGKRELPV